MEKRRFVGMIVLVVICCLLTSSFVFAEQKQPEETIVVRKSDLPPDLLKKLETTAEFGKYSEYINLGKSVGIAVREGLEAVTDTAAKFAKTDPGKFTMFIIAYKVIGKDFIQFIIGVPMLIIGIGLFIWSYRKNCITRQIPTEMNQDDKVKRYEIHEGSDEEKWAHIIVFLVYVGITMIVIFS
jgi:hypothetical protein